MDFTGPNAARLRLAGRALVLVFLGTGIAVAWVNRAALAPEALSAAIRDYPAAPLIFLLIHVVASLLFVPRSWLAITAGILFGIGGGILWAAVGSVVGALAGFLIARYLNSGMIDLEARPRLGPILLRAEEGGWRSVAALRLIPYLPHSFTNYALGLTRLSIASYIFGSLLGQLPMTVACVVLGAAGERMLAGHAGWLAPTLIGLAALAISLLVPYFAARRSGTPG